MPKNLYKVQKQVAKKRGGRGTNSLHENSRDSKRLQQAVLREEKLARQVNERAKANEGYLERVKFFKKLLFTATAPLTDAKNENIGYAAWRFTARNDGDYLALKNTRRPGRPPSAQEERLRSIIESEEKELRSGFWMPDLRNMETMRRLQQWDEQWSGLATMKFIRVVRGEKTTVKDSSFPPKGMS